MYIVPGYTTGKLTVHNSMVFFAGENCLILRPDTGTTLAMREREGKSFMNREITANTTFLLVQRALADYDESRPLADDSECALPSFFLIDLTKACNMACTYCFRKLDEQHTSMTQDRLAEICDALIHYWKAHPHLHITIQPWGGEPLLAMFAVTEIRKRFRDAELYPQIVIETNATLITHEVARCLYEGDVEVGISIDGHAQVHDIQRPMANGERSLHLVERGIANLRKAGYGDFGTITVVTQNTLAHLAEVICYFSKKLGLRNIKFNLMRKTADNGHLAIHPMQIDGYVQMLLGCLHDLYKQGIELVEQNVAQRIANLVCRPNNNICNACGCCGGYRMLSIDSEGYVYPCELSDYADYRLGRVGMADFSDMVMSSIAAQHEYLQERHIPSCTECAWRYFCRGGCRSAAKYASGSPLGIDETECRLNQSLYPRLVELLLTDPPFAQYLLVGGF